MIPERNMNNGISKNICVKRFPDFLVPCISSFFFLFMYACIHLTWSFQYIFIKCRPCVKPKVKYEGYNNKDGHVPYDHKVYNFLLKTHKMQLILNLCIVDLIFVIFLSVTVDWEHSTHSQPGATIKILRSFQELLAIYLLCAARCVGCWGD